MGAKGFLVFSSLFFYSWWNISYLPLILMSMLFNYIIGNTLNDNFYNVKISKKKILTVGVVFNIALLAYFKYTDFFIETANFVFNETYSLLNIALPLAISFFTFQQIAYLVDSYKKETSEYDFLNYALFVTFFPQLIAGPIVHHVEMMPQFTSKWNLIRRYKNISTGLFVFSIGLFKKVVIADTFAIFANQGFGATQALSFAEAWITSLSYSFQLYFDFSGYTDMAIGAALLFNIKLPVNFNSPYKALNIQEFWRRWHITLSRFLRDYIYIPLGGSWGGEYKTYANLFVTFLIGGLWHGAGWTFIFWGALHGMGLVLLQLWQKTGIKLNLVVSWFITFMFVNITWVFFRASEWDEALSVLKAMFGFNSFSTSVTKEFLNGYTELVVYAVLTLALASCVFFNNSMQWKNTFIPNLIFGISSTILMLLSMYFLHRPTEFLYFNF